ncbi:MAG: hypothetical protein HQ578_02395 [Chloroflexi bacterium]|nr:hypothetical protein [Chloroflexota bacterium]
MPSKSDRVFNLWVLLLQTRDATYNARNYELRQYGISSRDAGALHAIHSIGEKTTPAKISRWLYRKPNTIAGLLMRMQKKGLIKRSRDLESENLIRIGMSEEGKQAYNNALKRKSIHRIFRTLSDEECDHLFLYLMKIRDAALKETGHSIHRPLT